MLLSYDQLYVKVQFVPLTISIRFRIVLVGTKLITGHDGHFKLDGLIGTKRLYRS